MDIKLNSLCDTRIGRKQEASKGLWGESHANKIVYFLLKNKLIDFIFRAVKKRFPNFVEI